MIDWILIVNEERWCASARIDWLNVQCFLFRLVGITGSGGAWCCRHECTALSIQSARCAPVSVSGFANCFYFLYAMECLPIYNANETADLLHEALVIGDQFPSQSVMSPWICAMLGSTAIGVTGVLPILVIPVDRDFNAGGLY